jgi:tetratricopeptide (TPR) repeat protein
MFFCKKITVILSGLFLALIILEAGLRLEGIFVLSLQEYGNPQALKQKGTYRIMCLGDSTTAFGGKNSYPRQLENILNEMNPGMKFDVVNQGFAGATSGLILSNLNRNIKKFYPEMIIIMTGLNDGMGAITYEESPFKKKVELFMQLKTCKLIKLLWESAISKFRETKKPKLAKTTYAGKATPVSIGGFTKEKIALEMIALNPNNSVLYANLGFFYNERGREEEAEEMFKKAIEGNLNDYAACIRIGIYYSRRHIFVEAANILEKALEINPQNPDAYLYLGEVYTFQEKYQKAELILKKGISVDTNNYNLYVELGKCYLSWELEVGRAETIFKKAIAINPNGALAFSYLGKLYCGQKRFLEAEQVLKKALLIDPESALTKIVLEEYYRLRGKQRENENSYETFVKNYRNLKEIISRKGIKLVCVQYPLKSVKPLQDMFIGQDNIVFVDNEKIFRDAVAKNRYKTYFLDKNSAGFGHGTPEGNRLLAQNIATVIIKEVFGR